MWADDDKTYIGVYLDYAVVTAVLMVMFMYPIKNESQEGLLLLAFICVLWVYPTSCYEVTELSGCSVLDGPLSPF